MEKSLVRNLGVVDRGVRRARFAVLRDAAMPAILIEGGYMTHPAEGKKILRRGVSEADGGGDCERNFGLSKIDRAAGSADTGHRDKPSGGENSAATS